MKTLLGGKMETQNPLQVDSTAANLMAQLQANASTPQAVHQPPKAVSSEQEFTPVQPQTLEQAGLNQNDMIPLILKFLFLHGPQSGRKIANQLKLPFTMIEPITQVLKTELQIAHKQIAGVGDYIFELQPKGVESARTALARSTYCGAAPVNLNEYKHSVLRQSVKNLNPSYEDVANAFSDLIVSNLLVSQVGQAINSGKSLFLFGDPGNGKTSIATRAIRSVSKYIWIPRAITVGGEVVRLYDPSVHEYAPLPQSESLVNNSEVDERWIRIKRPTIVVGGELTMKHLEATLNPITGIIEAPIHVKSNCGCLVVDDFGRQRMSTTELLNRWIVPMESGNDFLNLPSGRQIQLPFEQLLIFSTNLEPGTLCDEAFLRRIPYKIEVVDPSEREFRELFKIMCPKMGFEYNEEAVDHLLMHHYLEVDRPFRNCQPRDLLMQVRNHCYYQGQEPALTPEAFDFAAENYFAVL